MRGRNITLILIALFFLFGCGRSDDTIAIGVILPLTGPVAEPGNNVLNGITLATENFNDESDIKVRLIVEDSRSEPITGVSAMNKLITADGVNIVIGDIMSSVTLAIAPIAERNRVILFSPGASNPALRKAGNYIFRNISSDDFDGYVMAQYVYHNLESITSAIIYVNNDYGLGLANVYQEEFESLGGNVLISNSYQEGETDFRTLLTRIRNNNPDVIYIIGNPIENGLLVRQMRELNMNTPVVGNLSFQNKEFLDVAQGSFSSIIFSAPYFDLDNEQEHIQKFLSLFLEEYGVLPNAESGLGYDAINIIFYALEKANFEVEGLLMELNKIENFNGVTGLTSIDEYGDARKQIMIKSIDGHGNISILKTFIPTE